MKIIATFRNVAIALGVSIGALLVGAAAQELLVRVVPAARAFSLGSIDIGSWVGFATLFLSFSLAGILQARWLRSSAILLWILLGPLLLAVIACSRGLDVSGCLRRWTALSHVSRISCGMVAATLWLPLLGALAGFLALRLWERSVARGEVAA
jgi:hypothetical protein